MQLMGNSLYDILSKYAVKDLHPSLHTTSIIPLFTLSYKIVKPSHLLLHSHRNFKHKVRTISFAASGGCSHKVREEDMLVPVNTGKNQDVFLR